MLHNLTITFFPTLLFCSSAISLAVFPDGSGRFPSLPKGLNPVSGSSPLQKDIKCPFSCMVVGSLIPFFLWQRQRETKGKSSNGKFRTLRWRFRLRLRIRVRSERHPFILPQREEEKKGLSPFFPASLFQNCFSLLPFLLSSFAFPFSLV